MKVTACFEPANRLGAIRIAEGEAALQRSQQAVAPPAEAGRERERAASSFARAEEVLLEAIELEPDPPAETWLNLGTAQRYLNKLAEARPSLEKALRKDPQNFRATFQLALLTEASALESGSAQERQRATELYGRASQLGPLPQEALERYGLLVGQGGDPARSAAILRTAVARNPGSPAAQALAELEQRERRIRELQLRIQEIVSRDANDPSAIPLTAQQLYLQGNYLQSSYLIETLFRQGTKTQELWYLLGVNKSAMNSFDQFLTDWPEAPSGADAQPWRVLAARTAEHGSWDAALASVGRMTPEERGGDGPLLTLARIAQEIGAAQRASTYLHQAADESPADPEPWLRLAELAIGLNQPAAASRFLAEAETRDAAPARLAELRDRAGVEADAPVRRFIVPQ